MKKYTYKEVANIIGIAPSQVNAKVGRKKFPEEFKTTVVNEQNREVKALTEEGLQRLKDEYGVTDKRVDEENKVLLGNLELVKQGDFLGTKCDFYKDMNDNIYMTREQIAQALEYKDKTPLVRLHQNYQDEFDAMSVQIARFERVVSKQHHLENVQNTQSDTLLYNEDGVYEITFLSRQPKANEFRAWVRERIKEIRKFGFTTQTNGGGAHTVDTMAEFLFGKDDSAGKLAFTELVKTKIKLEMENSKQKDLITVQNEQLEQQKPKVKFAEQIAYSDGVISVNSMAKLLHKNGVDIGQNRLYEWLRNNKLVMRMKENKQWSNIPTQKAVDKGILVAEEKSFLDQYGNKRIKTATKITPKGQYFILNKFLKDNEVIA